MQQDPQTQTGENRQSERHGPIRAMFSVLAGFFGVQSSANLERDAKYGNAGHFILAGLLATALLVVVIVVYVKFLMAYAG